MPITPHQRRYLTIAAVLLLLAACSGAYILYAWRDQLPSIAQLRDAILAFLQLIPPPLYFIAFIILPTFAVPLSAFYLTAIPVMGGWHPAIAVVCAWLALLGNLTFTRLIAAGWLRPWVESMLARRNRTIPTWDPTNEWQVVLAFRLSPLPWILQNYLLTMGRARWKTYLWMSWPIQCAIGLAMMLVGQSVLQGGLGYAMVAIAAFIIVHLLVKRIRRQLSKSANLNNATEL